MSQIKLLYPGQNFIMIAKRETIGFQASLATMTIIQKIRESLGLPSTIIGGEKTFKLGPLGFVLEMYIFLITYILAKMQNLP